MLTPRRLNHLLRTKHKIEYYRHIFGSMLHTYVGEIIKAYAKRDKRSMDKSYDFWVVTETSQYLYSDSDYFLISFKKKE
jgi:hypothetical protein